MPLLKTFAALALTTAPLLGASPAFSQLERFHQEIPQGLIGQILLENLNCHRCHAPDEPSRGAPDLTDVANRLHPGGIQRRLLEHEHIEVPKDTVAALTHYLRTLREPSDQVDDRLGDAGKGKRLYESIGCVACHGSEKNDVFHDYHGQGLLAYLKDPSSRWPEGGRMPNMQLTHWEARDVSAYLLEDAPMARALELDQAAAEQGRAHYERLGCATCHEAPADAVHSKARPFSIANLAAGCLGDAKTHWPSYSLAKWQRDAILAALRSEPDDTTPDHQLLNSLIQFNCLACHERSGLGGVAQDQDPYFTSADLNLGEQSRLPPTLTGVGAKLKPKWLRKVLQRGASVRPYMHTRMPVFERESMAVLSDLFASVDTPIAENEVSGLEERALREAGHRLTGVKGFGCIACHTYKGKSSTTLAAVELTSMTSRLRKGWFERYLRAPQDFQPLTIMPSYWPNGVSTRPDVLEGDPDKQIEALWRYLERGREARAPHGLQREPIVLKVVDEAVMLRRQYPGVGKRGIGVGYPSGIHLVFDAGQMRLASLWTGEFVEASGVWRGQGSGNVQPRSREVFTFPGGPALARLDSPSALWPNDEAKKAAGFQFMGYDLDAKRRPTFRYAFEDVNIEDHFVDSQDPSGRPLFTRTIRLAKRVPGLVFRAASAERIEKQEREWRINERLTITTSLKGEVHSQALVIPMNAAELTLTYQLLDKP